MSPSQERKVSVMYKSQLQEYAQKASIPPPVYEFEKEGASHEPRFKAVVILNNVTYESPPGFPNLKSAEHAAAKVALDGLLQSTGGAGVVPNPVHESGLCKNLLQEYAQKNSLPLPVYQSQRSGEDHAPTFTSSVEIAGVKYSGGFAKNKKEAEIKAARTALLAIQSAQASIPAQEIATAPQANVGLATLISTHLNNASGKKRGRGAVHAAADEPSAARVKTAVQVTPAPVEASAKSTNPVATSEKNENAHLNGATVQKKGGTAPQPKGDQPASVRLKAGQAPSEVTNKDTEGKSTVTETDVAEKKVAPETTPEEVKEKQQITENSQSTGLVSLKTR